MSTIESHSKNYSVIEGYMTPSEVEHAAQIPETHEEQSLYSAAHCMVRERFEKSELVDLVYALLKREHGII